MMVAARSNAEPMPSCTALRGRPATMPAPSHAPAQAAAISKARVVKSTSTICVKMIAWVTVGTTWPTLSVPGINSSGTIFQARNIAVVGANEPMPSVSKKFVTAPMKS